MCELDALILTPYHWNVASTLLHSVYGFEVKSPNDRFLAEAQRVIGNLSRKMLPSSRFPCNGGNTDTCLILVTQIRLSGEHHASS